MRRIYIETSVWGMVAPGQNPVLQEPTVEFVEQCERGVFETYISDVVADEIRLAPSEVQEAVNKWIARVSPIVLSLDKGAKELAQRFIDEGVLPERRLEDGLHVSPVVLSTNLMC